LHRPNCWKNYWRKWIEVNGKRKNRVSKIPAAATTAVINLKKGDTLDEYDTADCVGCGLIYVVLN
jgi:hypothetical protein